VSYEDEVQEKSVEKEKTGFIFSSSEHQEVPNESEIKIKHKNKHLHVKDYQDNSDILDN
jgi:hypothetical protein